MINPLDNTPVRSVSCVNTLDVLVNLKIKTGIMKHKSLHRRPAKTRQDTWLSRWCNCRFAKRPPCAVGSLDHVSNFGSFVKVPIAKFAIFQEMFSLMWHV